MCLSHLSSSHRTPAMFIAYSYISVLSDDSILTLILPRKYRCPIFSHASSSVDKNSFFSHPALSLGNACVAEKEVAKHLKAYVIKRFRTNPHQKAVSD